MILEGVIGKKWAVCVALSIVASVAIIELLNLGDGPAALAGVISGAMGSLVGWLWQSA